MGKLHIMVPAHGKHSFEVLVAIIVTIIALIVISKIYECDGIPLFLMR